MKPKTRLLAGLALVLVLVAVIPAVVLMANKQESSTTGNTVNNAELPSYATYNPKVEEAYRFAVENPEALNGVNCYCGCMQHAHGGRIHRRGLLDCYMWEDGRFEEHASQCDMCINDALDVKRWTEDGISKEEIKQRIDQRYSGLGH